MNDAKQIYDLKKHVEKLKAERDEWRHKYEGLFVEATPEDYVMPDEFTKEEELEGCKKEIEKLNMGKSLLLDQPVESQNRISVLAQQRDEFALLLFEPRGASHHDANECPYLQGKFE